MTTDHKPTLADELLPCPFCGGKAERIDIEEGENAGGSCISCTRCLASSNVEFEFKENFVSNWNRRAAPEAVGEREELAKLSDQTAESWEDMRDPNAAEIARQHRRIATLLRQPAAEPNEAEVRAIVRVMLNEGAMPEYKTWDDNGCEESEYVEYFMEMLARLCAARATAAKGE